MDESRDLMVSTFEYLMKGEVEGSRFIAPDQLTELILYVVNKSAAHLRMLSLLTIKDQLPSTSMPGSGLPDACAKTRAFKVYAIGEEAWSDAFAEYWFVEQNGTWHWVRCGASGWRGGRDYGRVTIRHLVDRLTNSETGLAPISLLGNICSIYAQRFDREAAKARQREEMFQKAVVFHEGMHNRVRGIEAIPNQLPEL